jgi:hypothetical protein
MPAGGTSHKMRPGHVRKHLTGAKRLAWPWAFRRWSTVGCATAGTEGDVRMVSRWSEGGRGGGQGLTGRAQQIARHSRTWAVPRNGRDWRAPSAGTRPPRAHPGTPSTTVHGVWCLAAAGRRRHRCVSVSVPALKAQAARSRAAFRRLRDFHLGCGRPCRRSTSG